MGRTVFLRYIPTFPGYLNLLRNNRNFRLYCLSHICQHAGDWFVHVSTIISIERLDKSSTALSILVLTKTLPETVLSPVGGMLADTFDRRRLMIIFDTIGGFIVLGYIMAVRAENLGLLYAVSVLRYTIKSLYEPVTRSIVPLLVSGKEDLQRATTMSGMVWSSMMIVGGLVGGIGVASMGVEACYALDSITYFISAMIMASVTGNFLVVEKKSDDTNQEDKNSSENKDTAKKTLRQRIRGKLWQAMRPFRYLVRMCREMICYLWVCGFGLNCFMKASGSTTWGPADILNAAYAHIEGDEDETSRRIGLLFSFTGIGCIFGPVTVNYFIDANRPSTLQKVVVSSYAFLVVGWLGIAHAPSFSWICFFTSIRAFGAAVIWVDSTLILQTLASSEMLGRVLGFDYAMAQLSEAGSAFVTGRMEDAGRSRHDIADIAAIVGTTFLFLWSVYHVTGRGAASKQFNELENQSESDSKDEEGLQKLELKEVV